MQLLNDEVFYRHDFYTLISEIIGQFSMHLFARNLMNEIVFEGVLSGSFTDEDNTLKDIEYNSIAYHN